MRKPGIALVVLIILLATNVQADEVQELRNEVKMLKKVIQDQQLELERLRVNATGSHIVNSQIQGNGSANLKVRVGGINKSKGEIGVALYDSKNGYPINFQYTYDSLWVPLKEAEEVVEVAFDGLPPGEYAVSVLHDENGNRRMDRNRLGFPREGVGFSNGQKVVFGSPSFEKSKFALSGGESKEIVIMLDYRKE